MINCAHPTHFDQELAAGASWVERIRGLRANASTMSHAELDEATELDAGDPEDLGRRYRNLRQRMPHLCVLGAAAAPIIATSQPSAPRACDLTEARRPAMSQAAQRLQAQLVRGIVACLDQGRG